MQAASRCGAWGLATAMLPSPSPSPSVWAFFAAVGVLALAVGALPAGWETGDIEGKPYFVSYWQLRIRYLLRHAHATPHPMRTVPPQLLPSPPCALLTCYGLSRTAQYHVDDPGKILWEPPAEDATSPPPVPPPQPAEPAAGGAEEKAAAAAGEPTVLFTLQINVTDLVGEGVGEGGVLPLAVPEGLSPTAVAAQFAAAHGLPDASRDELAVAIMQYAKQNGFVAPTFSIP
eukprot:COSAG01_NODE_22965_length_834_cov_0.906122_1_plen_230_part_01